MKEKPLFVQSSPKLSSTNISNQITRSTVDVVNILGKKEPAPPRTKLERKEDRKVVRKLFPNSPLFREWGGKLTEEEQEEAERLFQRYGYNAFLSNRLPLHREIPDTRPSR